MIELLLLFLFFLVFFNYMLLRDYAYPPFIFSAVWLFVLFVYYLLAFTDIVEHVLSDSTLIIFGTGVLLFSAGGLIHYFLLGRIHWNSRILDYHIKINRLLDNFFFWTPLALLPFFIKKAITIASHSEIDNFFIGLRSQLTSYTEDFGILKYAISIAFFNVWFRTLLTELESGKNRPRYYISFVVALAYVVFSTGRGYLFLLLTPILGIKLITDKFSIKHVAYFPFIFLVFFSLFAIILGKGGSLTVPFLENVVNISVALANYLTGPLSAFDVYLKSHEELSYGHHSFRFIYALLFKVGLTNTSPVDLIQPFVFVPFPVNVYTVYYTYSRDFGVVASLLFVGFFGFLHSFFYYKVRSGTGSFLSYYMYALMLFPVLMSFFQDQFLSLISLWIQFLCFSVLFFLAVKIDKSKTGFVKGTKG